MSEASSIVTPDEDKTCGHHDAFGAIECGKPAASFWTYGNSIGFLCAEHDDGKGRPIDQLRTELIRRQRHLASMFGDPS